MRLRRRRVRGVDLWVEIEENHGARRGRTTSPLGARLEHLLSTLPEAQRAALVLRYQEDLLPEEIAATIGCAAGDGEEQSAARTEAAARQGNQSFEGVHSWSLNRWTTLNRNCEQALERRPAPPSLKRKVMERRGLRTMERRHSHWLIWQRVAAGLLLAAMLGGAMEWKLRRAEERRKGEEARRQVMTALRITGHALNEVNGQLAARNRGGEE